MKHPKEENGPKVPLRDIFILDDDESFSQFASLQLRAPSEEFERFNVSTFCEPYEFIGAIEDPVQSGRVVLVIIDYILEGPIHGFTVADRLAKDYPDIAQLFCTSYTNAKVFEKICTSSACARNFLEKPVSQGKELRKKVEDTLSLRDEFFTRFEFKKEISPFPIPRLPRARRIFGRRKEDKKDGPAPPAGE